MVEGLIALAIPIKDKRGGFVSSLSFHAPTQRLTFVRAHQHLDRLHAAVAELRQILKEDSEMNNT